MVCFVLNCSFNYYKLLYRLGSVYYFCICTLSVTVPQEQTEVLN